MENANEKPDEKTPEELDELKKKKEFEDKGKTTPRKASPKVSRERDFAHIHPDHAKHKTFGLDHEPGAL